MVFQEVIADGKKAIGNAKNPQLYAWRDQLNELAKETKDPEFAGAIKKLIRAINKEIDVRYELSLVAQRVSRH